MLEKHRLDNLVMPQIDRKFLTRVPRAAIRRGIIKAWMGSKQARREMLDAESHVHKYEADIAALAKVGNYRGHK
jgi:hypothetical protein